MPRARDYANDHKFAMWEELPSDAAIEDLKSRLHTEIQDTLKTGAAARGCDPDSIYDLKIEQHPSFPNKVIVSAYFKKKE